MNVLFVGAGKNLGQALLLHMVRQGHCVFHITGHGGNTAVNELTVDWAAVQESTVHRWLSTLPNIDIIFFNQNSSSLSKTSFNSDSYSILNLWKQLAHWKQSHYVSCQLPFQIIHTLGNRLGTNSRVCWMLSSMIIQHRHDPSHADYIANKFQNYLMIENFSRSHPSCFLGIEPGAAVRQTDHNQSVQQILQTLDRPVAELNGAVYQINGEKSPLFRVFA